MKKLQPRRGIIRLFAKQAHQQFYSHVHI